MVLTALTEIAPNVVVGVDVVRGIIVVVRIVVGAVEGDEGVIGVVD